MPPSWLKESRAPQPVLRHPCGGLPAEAVGRGTVFLPDGLDLAQGKRFPQAGARRLEKGLLGGKICGSAGKAVGVQRCGGCFAKPQCRLLSRAVHPAHKGRRVSRGKAFFQMGKAAQVAADAVKHTKAPFAGRMPPGHRSSCRNNAGNFVQDVQIQRNYLEVSAQFVYNETSFN